MNQRTLEAIQLSTAGSLDGSLSFPEAAAMLMEVGVSRYHVDFTRAEKTAYLRDGDSHVEPMVIPETPVAEAFSAEAIAKAVRASQTEGLPYPEFLVRARRAGCVGYVAYLDGRRVIYAGSLGDEHIERLPPAP